MESIIKDTKTLLPEEIRDILKVLITKIEKGGIKFFVIREFYVNYEAYREKIAKAIAKSNIVIKLSEMAALRTMYKIDPENLNDSLNEMIAKGTLKEKILEQIKQ